MRKIFFLALIFVVFTAVAQDKPTKKTSGKQRYDQIRRAYAYLEEELVVSWSDLYCSYFIGSTLIDEDIVITGAEHQIFDKKEYTDNEKMFINKGSASGLNEGDVFMVLEKGKRFRHPFTHKKMGWHYMQKARAEITCIYENKAVVTLQKGCFPVKIGDILIPFKPQQTVFKRKINYKRCRLPDGPSTITSTVIFQSLYEISEKVVAGYGDYVIIDIGKALVEKGNYLLFYIDLGPDLPYIICGSGVVVNPQNNTATVKLLDGDFPTKVGYKAVLVPKSEEPVSGEMGAGEDIPIQKTAKQDERQAEPGEESIEVGILFDINKKVIDDHDKYSGEFEKIKEFISSKSQYVVVLRGYTCSIGGLEYNLRLSKERVDSVKAYLMSALGIPENFIETYFYGEKDAPFDNTSEEQRRKNRLVNIQVIGK